MPRIRTIKPEFWDSPSTAKASAVARLAYIGMWNWADDHGRGTANLKELEGFIFPNDDIKELSHGSSENFRDVVAEVIACFGVAFYEVAGRNYYQIAHWEKHQRNERKATSKYPSIEEADSLLDVGVNGISRKLRDTITEAPQISDTGTGEQGNRGTGEQDNSAAELRDAPDAQNAQRTKREKPYTPVFLQFWEQYPRKQDKRRAFEAWEKIPNRHPTQIIAAAKRYANDPNREDAYTKMPASWINARAWEDETPLPPRPTQPTNRPWAMTYDDKLAATQQTINQLRAEQTPPHDTTQKEIYW